MNTKKLKIAISGDVCTNVLTWRTFKKNTKGFKWENIPVCSQYDKRGWSFTVIETCKLSL